MAIPRQGEDTDPAAPPLVMILGSPRSGTSWIGRIFDSVPETFYLHEPDLEIYDPDFPVVPDPDASDELLPYAERLLGKLTTSRPLRAVASRPILRKPYRSPAAHALRVAMIHGLRGLEVPLGRRLQRLDVPDLVDRPEHGPRTLVLKSVTAHARMAFFMKLRPDMPVVHVIRHPCGMVASELRGIRLGKMGRPHLFDRQLALAPARRRGLDRAAADALSDVELFAWEWLIMNEWLMERSAPGARILHLDYDRLCLDPLAEAKTMLEFCGLPWALATEDLLSSSIAAGNVGKAYHATVRDPALASSRWKRELAPEDAARVMGIVQDSLPGRLFAE